MPHETVDGSSCTNRKTLLNTGCNREQDVYLVNAIHVVASGLREVLIVFLVFASFNFCLNCRVCYFARNWSESFAAVYADWKLQSSQCGISTMRMAFTVTGFLFAFKLLTGIRFFVRILSVYCFWKMLGVYTTICFVKVKCF